MSLLGAIIAGKLRARQTIVSRPWLRLSHAKGVAVVRRLPPLNALKAFEAAARHESFTQAAQELCVTQGAVSQQVKALETELGCRLFNREHRRLVITAAGRGYLGVVRDAFDQLALGTEALLQQHKSGVLSVSTSPNFASKWLVHRLGRFAEQHPAIVLKLSASLQHVDFAREDFDLAIRHGDGQWPGLDVTRLCEEELFPVCSPALARALRTPQDLKKHTLLHIDERRDWGAWLEKAGADGVDFARGPVFNQASMAIDAAVDGQGVALARSALAAWDLGVGRLVRPFAAALKLPYSYWIVCPKPTASLPKIATFRAWLLSEAAADLRRVARGRPGRKLRR
jgi:LysR family glycine cleavage system transcriptional activator